MPNVTVGDVIERLYVQWLTPPDDQPAHVRLGISVSASEEVFVLGGFTIPEDEALLRQGSLLALGQELVRVVSYDDVAGSITVTRGEYGTTPAAHTVPLLMELNPVYPRHTVFEAVADNILQLYPRLFTVQETFEASLGSSVFPCGDDLAVEMLSAWKDWQGEADYDGKVVDFHPITSGRAFILNSGSGSMWIRYRRRMGSAESETDKLVDLGVDPRWTNIVMTGAAADLFVGKDIPAVQTEWIKSALEAQNVRVGTRMSVAGGLRQYHAGLIDQASKEMRGEYKPKVHMRKANTVV